MEPAPGDTRSDEAPALTEEEKELVAAVALAGVAGVGDCSAADCVSVTEAAQLSAQALQELPAWRSEASLTKLCNFGDRSPPKAAHNG